MLYRIHNNIIATNGIQNKLQLPPPPTSTTKTQPAVLAATLQNPIPAVLIPAENHQRLE